MPAKRRRHGGGLSHKCHARRVGSGRRLKGRPVAQPIPKSSYAAELRALTAEVIRMGGLAEAQVVDAVDAVVRRDVPLAQALIVRDLRLDQMQAEIERA